MVLARVLMAASSVLILEIHHSLIVRTSLIEFQMFARTARGLLGGGSASLRANRRARRRFIQVSRGNCRRPRLTVVADGRMIPPAIHLEMNQTLRRIGKRETEVDEWA